MALRKKHVRRTVFALLFLLVLGPLAALLLYGVWLRTGGMDARLERELASRLRCKALVRGAHPTGLQTAVADEVELVWQAGEGRLLVVLEDLKAEAGASGWYVRAPRGSVTLSGPDPAATLAAVNQRLVQSEPAPPLVSLVVERLRADLDLGLARLSGETVAIALSNAGAFRVSFLPVDTLSAENVARLAGDTLVAPGWTVDLVLDAASDRGVFGGLKVDAKEVPAAEIRELLGHAQGEGGPAAGTFDASVAWRWPEAQPDAATVTVQGDGLDLADWTASLPGGPLTGKAALRVAYRQSGDAAARVEWSLTSEQGGLVAAETLSHIEASVPAVEGFGDLLTGRIGYDRLSVHFRGLTDGRGALAEGEESSPLITTTLFGEEVPILWATPEPFDGRAAWQRLWSADESP